MYSYDRILLALFAALVISLAVTPLVRELARRRSLLDLPNHRSSHTIPVPRLGGVSIAIASLAGAAILGGGRQLANRARDRCCRDDGACRGDR